MKPDTTWIKELCKLDKHLADFQMTELDSLRVLGLPVKRSRSVLRTRKHIAEQLNG